MISPKPTYRNVSSPPWSEVFLVGGGPSLKGFDFERLRGRTVCAINDAMFHVPWAACVFSADQTWVKQRTDDILKFQGEKCFVSQMDTDSPLLAHYADRCYDIALSDDSHKLHVRGCSGYGALNLAYLKGAKRIVLLGYDFVTPDTHWYANYPWQPKPGSDSGRSKMYLSWAKFFDDTVPQLKAAGVEVLNASLISAVTAFPKISLDEVL